MYIDLLLLIDFVEREQGPIHPSGRLLDLVRNRRPQNKAVLLL